MTVPSDPSHPTYRDPLDADTVLPTERSTPLEPPTAPPVIATPVTPVSPEPVTAAPPIPARTDHTDESGGGKIKAAALIAGAAALANKVRKEAPKKAREVREKRIAGRYVIITEADGRPVAIGPYRDEQAAHHDLTRATNVQHVLELKSPAAYFGSSDSGAGTTP